MQLQERCCSHRFRVAVICVRNGARVFCCINLVYHCIVNHPVLTPPAPAFISNVPRSRSRAASLVSGRGWVGGGEEKEEVRRKEPEEEKYADVYM